jgi:1-acyl-sn-glycerol-3-phosphate acyltransferase
MRASLAGPERMTLAHRAASLVWDALFFLWSAIFISFIIAVAAVRPGSAYYSLARAWARMTLRWFGVRVETVGVSSIVRGRDYVLLCNHRSQFDPLAIIVALTEHETRWVAKRELLRVPVFGFALRVTGQILIDRRDHEQALRQLEANLGKRGASVVFFPEGRRAESASLLPFKKGGAAFAIEAGWPVVPVAIWGSDRVLPPHSFHVRPGTIRVLIGEPIEVASLTAADRDSVTEDARLAIERMLAWAEPSSAGASAAEAHACA